jgi:Domain of unknown function (DUF6456)
MSSRKSALAKSAEQLLLRISNRERPAAGRWPPADVAALLAADLVQRHADGRLEISAAGRAHLARRDVARAGGNVDPFRAQHLDLAQRRIETADGAVDVMVDDGESPLAWLARRKGRDGRALIEPLQLQAGERLRADFTRAHVMPRVTSNWEAPIADGVRSARSEGAGLATDAMIAARQGIHHALDAVGPEFAGLLIDVCCFLKRLEDVERERRWPPRSAKVVLQLGLARLARHYGLDRAARGPARASIQTWLAPDAEFVIEME